MISALVPRHFGDNWPPFAVCFVGCFGVSKISDMLSRRYLASTYNKLDKRGKEEWNSHAVSLVHSLLVVPASIYTLRHSPIALSKALYGYDSLTGSLHAFSLGYFAWDVLYELYTKNGIFLVHGAFSALAYLYSFTPMFMNLGPAFLLWEASTPFVNFNWFMDRNPSWKKSNWYLANGVALTSSFFLARIAFGGLMSKIFFDTIREHHKSLPTHIMAVYVAGNITLNLLNLNWFYKMICKIKRMYNSRLR